MLGTRLLFQLYSATLRDTLRRARDLE